MPAPLADAYRKKYPGAYDDVPDADLDRAVRAKYPGKYDDVPGPSKGILDTAKDLGIGALKGLGDTLSQGMRVPGLINSMATATYGHSPARQAIAEDQAPVDRLLSTLEPSNTTQQVGKYGEIAAEVLGPLGFSRLQKFIANRPPALVVDRYLANKSGYKGAADTFAESASGVPGSVVDRYLPNRSGYTPGSASRNTTLKTGAAVDPDRYLPNKSGYGPSREFGEPASVRGGTSEGLKEQPLFRQMDEIPTEGAVVDTSMRTGAPRMAPPSRVPTLKPKAPKVTEPLASGPTQGRSRGGRDATSNWMNSRRAIHGDDVATVGNGLYKVSEAARTAPTPEAAAQTIEDAIEVLIKGGTPPTRVKLSADQSARVLRARYGSARAGKLLQPNQPAKVGAAQIKRLAPGESKMPQIVKESIQDTSGLMSKGTEAQQAGYATTLQRYAKEGGAANPKVIGSVAGGAAGAAYGATKGDTDEDRLFNAALFGVGGAFVVPFIAHAAAVGAPKAVKDYLFASTLSSPGTVAKAYSGAVGGAVGMAAEKLAVGNVRDGGAILKALFSDESAKTFIRALKEPVPSTLSGYTADAAPNIVGRVYGAADAMARRAMQAGGVSAEDAARATLSGAPTTEIGKHALAFFNQHFSAKLIGSLFPRVGIQVLERGAERSPLGLVGLKGLNEGAATATRVARAAGGTGAGLAAYESAEDTPAWVKPYLVALSGMYALPVAAGMAVSDARKRGKSELRAATDEVARNLPFPQFGPAEALDPFRMAASFVPNALRDVAEARDPYQRDTAGSGLNRIKAKIPGLRETLPVRGAKTNIAGQPNEDRSSAARRFISRPAYTGDKFKDVPELIVKELQRLAVEINPPSFESTIKIGNRTLPVPPDVAEKRRVEARQYVIPRIQKVMQTAEYRRGSDERKKQLLKVTIDQARADGNAKARANVVRLLKQRGTR